MDIEKTGGHFAPQTTRQGRIAKPEKSFENIFSKVQKNLEPQSMAQAGAVMPPPGVPGCGAVEAMASQQADRLLDLLEKYAQALNDSDKSLKSMSPMVEQMEFEAKAAKGVLLGLDRASELARTVNKVAVYASVEAFKFRRGDYIE